MTRTGFEWKNCTILILVAAVLLFVVFFAYGTKEVRAEDGRPGAIIESISPNPAESGETVSFYGNGTSNDSIKLYNWRIEDTTGVEIFSHLTDSNVSSWATKFIIVNVRVENPDNNRINITDRNVLEQMSLVEDAVNPHLFDNGNEDGVVSCYSISVIIKEINSTASHSGTYDIPESRNTIDNYVKNNMSKKQLEGLLADINADGIWDSAKIVIDISNEADSKQIRKAVNSAIEESSKHDGNTDIQMDVEQATYLPAGIYTVFLKVQDKNGNWSNEVSSTVEIKSRDSDDSPGFEAALLAFGMVISMAIYRSRKMKK